MNSDYWKLAIGNLRHRGTRSWLTLLGIFIGITAVIALISLGAGLKLAVSSQFGISNTEVITVQAGGISWMGPPGTGVAKRLTKKDVQAIERLSTVDLAIGRNIETFKLEYNNIVSFSAGFGVHGGEKGKWDYAMQNIQTEKGRLIQDGDKDKVLLGNNYGFKDKSGFKKAVSVGDKIKINGKRFQVVGILKKKGSFIIDNVVGISVGDLKDLENNGDYVDLISVKIKNKNLMNKAKEQIEQLMRKRRNVKVGEEDFEVSTPQAMLKTVNNILGGVQIFIVIIASISILVGALGIVNTMTTSVLERRKEIGIMKAVGAKNSQIFMQFLIESGLLGLVGGIAGVVVGIAIGYFGTLGIGNFTGAEIRPDINFFLIGGALLGSFIVGSVAGIIPAMKAAKQNPSEAMRG